MSNPVFPASPPAGCVFRARSPSAARTNSATDGSLAAIALAAGCSGASSSAVAP